ncbi:MAG: ABC transporter permease, partial [Victivallaceae bacterium]
GGLIILSSLLGSIADREREIFTFSALGLSPFDVSVLFFAESGVYAIIGGLGGYLFSQFVGILLRYLASFGWVEAPEMNYSSLSTIYTILIVMVTVLLSTVYPAIKAGRAASPDVARKWQMPAAQGNKLSFHFPFTVSSVDFGGILMFISEHFKNHSDSSLGAFTAGGVEVIENYEGDKGIALKAELTLAPFDLGVAETFCMYSTQSDIAGINVVAVDIEKLGGTNAAWLRANQRFVNEIRNQFLLWRSLPLDTVVHYRSLAAGKIKRNEGDV